ncbi:MAG: hypothetical protein CUN53_13975 [Phototrophicales bacterium]|nr:MAG: hypothetical protein CUN53_13975 [Phototrophicales bacterium]
MRAYFASDWHKAQEGAAKALAVLASAYENDSAPHMESIRVIKRIEDERSRRVANEAAALAALEADAAAHDPDPDVQTQPDDHTNNRDTAAVTHDGSTAGAVADAATNEYQQQQQKGGGDENQG